MNARLDGFLSRLGAARSVQQTWDEIVSFQKSLGFDLIEYGYAAAMTGGASSEMEVVHMSNFPAAYRERYHQEQYDRDDPVVRYCIDHLSPRLVGRDSLGLSPDQGRSLTAIQRRIVDEAAECGMRVGMAIPMRSPGRHPIAGMSLSNAMAPVEFQSLMAEWGDVALLAALYAHNHLQMILQTAENRVSDIVLSLRERECLLWVSRGMSSKEAAQRIGLSSKTVDYHLANAMGKLKAATRGQALARAVTLGLLEP